MEQLRETLNRNLDCACDGTALPAADKMDVMEHHYTYMAEAYNKREGNLHEQDGYTCDKCKNKGYIAKAVWTEFGYWTRVDYECECMPIRRNIARMYKSGLRDVIGRYSFDTYEGTAPWQQTVKQKAMTYVNTQIANSGEANWFFIGGVSGAGKSHICTAICRALLHNGKGVRYMLWRDESVKLKATVNDAVQYEKMMQELKTVEVLYIDDFFKIGQMDGGIQKPTAADISLAFEILNYRYNHADKVTIISSESTLEEIFAIDAAVGGRIGERSMGYAINLSGKEKNYRCKMMGVAV